MKKLLLSILTISSLTVFSQWTTTSIFSTGEDCFTAFGKVLAADNASSALDASSDDGATWSASNTGISTAGLNFGVLNGTTLYAYKGTTIYQSTTGNNWTANNTSVITSTDVIKGMAAIGGTVLAVTNPVSGPGSKIYQLSGTTWSLRSTYPGALITTIKNLNGTLWAGTTATLVLKSTNGGITFTNGATGLNPTNWWDKYVFCLGSTPTAIFFGTYGGRIFKSTDGGTTWSVSYTSGASSTFAISDMYTTTSNNLLVACDSGFVYTTNNGTSWSKSNAGFNYPAMDYQLGKVTASANYLFAATKNGTIYRRALSQIFSGINENVLPMVESKAYPNPACGKATIESSDLLFDDNCSVKVTDVLGREISMVNMNAGKAELNLSDYSKGMYTYTIYNNKQIVGKGKLIVQ